MADKDNTDLKKKRGRRKKTDSVVEENIQLVLEEEVEVKSDANAPSKKRGRKPKGGKLILKSHESVELNATLPNIILHLKCSMRDLTEHNEKINHLVTDPLNYNPSIPPEIQTYADTDAFSFSLYNSEMTPVFGTTNVNESVNNVGGGGDSGLKPEVPSTFNDYAYNESNKTQEYICQCCKKTDTLNKNGEIEYGTSEDDGDVNIKDVNAKLKQLKIQLYKNTMHDKKSACFWCSYEFDNDPCYIPKYEMDQQIYGYGSFCRPECAVGYLMKENIDDSTKFERYHLLNKIYSKVYDYKKNIKPAPNPYFLLDKYYGNLSIQEYRKLLKTEHMLLVIDKPLTRILPELHEDNDDFILNIYGGKQAQTAQGGVYKVKRQSEKQQGPSKNSIMRDQFGM